MKDLWERILKYAQDNPVKFVAMGSFTTLGGVPLLAFLAYSAATLVASVIGAVIMELFLLAVGITGLAFVLFFVTCMSVCATSVFAAAYFTYKMVTSAFCKGKDWRLGTPVWPFISSANPSECSEPQSAHQPEKKK